jgi:inorganic triphosphatase YgiF
MLEEERKYEVAAGFRLPDLTECVPEGGRLIVRPPRKLRATYFDTSDLRLARAGASLRYRRADDEPWTVKLPTDAPGVRNEISMSGPGSTPPERLLDLVTVYTRGAPIAPVVTLVTIREAYQLCDRDDRVAVEVVDDTVTVPDGRRVALKFREIEVERKAGKARLLDRVEVALRDAGAIVGEFTPKHVRALGPAALQPPEWPAAPSRLPRRPTVADVVTVAIQRDIARIVTHDPLVRLRATVGQDDTAVHQMRIGCRRLRSDLRTFAWPTPGPRGCRASWPGWPPRSVVPATPRCCGPGCGRPPRLTPWPRWTRRAWPASTPTWPCGRRTRWPRWTR